MPLERLHPDSSDDAELAFHWHRYQAVAPALAGGDVLDVGTGGGYGAEVLAQSAHRVVAVDVDPSAVAQAEERYRKDNLKFFTASALLLPFGDDTFDAVVAFELLEHLPREQHPIALAEWKRVLKPSGVVVLSTPDHDRMREFPDNPYHLGELTEAELRGLLAQHFATVHLYYQELNAASIIWGPGGHPARDPTRSGTSGRGFALRRSDDGVQPVPVGHDTHLTLLAVAADDPSAADTIQPTGFLVESSRRLLKRLWSRVDGLTDAVDAARRQDQAQQQRVEEAARTAAWLREENQALWQQNRVLARETLAATETIAALTARVAELEQAQDGWGQDHQELARLTERLGVIEGSRGWRLVNRYWRALDAGTTWTPALRAARRVVLGRRAKPPSERDPQ